VTRRRLELLQWYALLGGAVAWAAQHVAGYFVSTAACGSPAISSSVAQIVIASGAAVLVLAAEASAVVVFRATRPDDPAPGGRLHFFAEAALLGNLLFLVIVVLTGFSSVYQLPCAQS
jgi:hypothetical protein